MKTNILDIQFDNLTREEARQAGAELLRSSDFHYAVTPNPEFILTADKDLEFQKILNQADLVLPDGIGVVYSAKILGTPLKERVAGFDFACDMLDVLDEMGGRLYLLGSKPGVAEEAGRRILEQHPNIVLCGVHDGYFQDSDPVAHEVAQAQPDLLFVCLARPSRRSGSPASACSPGPSWPSAWGALWMCSPAMWSGPRSSGRSWEWSGPTAW